MSIAIVKAVRDTFPTPLGAQHALFLMVVAGKLGLGLLRKDSGTIITLPDGVTVSQDVLINRSGDAWDILIDGENKAIPTFDTSLHIDDASRYYSVNGASAPGPILQVPQSPALLESFMLDVRASLGRVEGLLATLQNAPAPSVVVPSVKFPRYQGSTTITLPIVGKQTVTVTLDPKE